MPIKCAIKLKPLHGTLHWEQQLLSAPGLVSGALARLEGIRAGRCIAITGSRLTVDGVQVHPKHSAQTRNLFPFFFLSYLSLPFSVKDQGTASRASSRRECSLDVPTRALAWAGSHAQQPRACSHAPEHRPSAQAACRLCWCRCTCISG